VPKLVDRLSDPKDNVRDGCVSVLRRIADVCVPIKLVLLFRHYMRTAAIRTKEEIVKLYILVISFKCPIAHSLQV